MSRPAISLEAQQFGHWTVVGPPQRVSVGKQGLKQTVHPCRCDCGAEAQVARSNLVSGISKSCGCAIGQPAMAKMRGRDLGRTSPILSVELYNKILRGAADRMYRVHSDVTRDFLQELYDRQNGRCVLSNMPIEFATNRKCGKTTASLDRKDNKKHYTRENVQWLHKDVNRIKHILDQERFIELCRAVADTMTW